MRPRKIAVRRRVKSCGAADRATASLRGFPNIVTPTHGTRELDEQERRIVRHLIRDPRESDNGIGEATGVNVRTVGRKRQKLEQAGVRSYFPHLDLSSSG